MDAIAFKETLLRNGFTESIPGTGIYSLGKGFPFFTTNLIFAPAILAKKDAETPPESIPVETEQDIINALNKYNG